MPTSSAYDSIFIVFQVNKFRLCSHYNKKRRATYKQMLVQNGNIRLQKFQFNPQAILGKGATGNVYKGYRLKDGHRVAIKAIQMRKVSNDVTNYLLEGQKTALKTIKNPYVIQAYDIVQTKEYCYIVMEICTGGTLKDYIKKKGKLTEKQAIEFFRKILNGYIAVKQCNIIHRDLKTANIMLKTNNDPVIIDFGFCQMIMGKRPGVRYNVGSPSYMSPQAYTKNMYSQKSDIWALGVILYQMLTGVTLDNQKDSRIYFEQLKKFQLAPYSTEEFSPLIKNIFDQVFITNPLQRATCLKIKYIIDKAMIGKMIPIPINAQGKQNLPLKIKRIKSLNMQFSSFSQLSPNTLKKQISQNTKPNVQIKSELNSYSDSPLRRSQNVKSHHIIAMNRLTQNKTEQNAAFMKPVILIPVKDCQQTCDQSIMRKKSFEQPKIIFSSMHINSDRKEIKIENPQQVMTPNRIMPMQKQIKFKIIGSLNQTKKLPQVNSVQLSLSPNQKKRFSSPSSHQSHKLVRFNSQKRLITINK